MSDTLTDHLLSAFTRARTKHYFVTGNGKTQTQPASRGASATNDSNPHSPSLTQTACANYG